MKEKNEEDEDAAEADKDEDEDNDDDDDEDGRWKLKMKMKMKTIMISRKLGILQTIKTMFAFELSGDDGNICFQMKTALKSRPRNIK